MHRWKTDTLLSRFEMAMDDHARTRQWKRETRDEALRKRYSHRIWAIKRIMNKMVAEMERRLGETVNAA